MALLRRGQSKIWHVDITKPGGGRHRESTGTENKQLAQAYHDKLKVDLWKENKLGVTRDHLFDEAADLFLHEKRNCKSLSDYENQMAWWKVQFKGLNVREINQSLILKAIAKKEATVSPTTCNRYLAALRAAMRLICNKHQWIDSVPPVFLNKEPKGVVRWIGPEEIERLMGTLPEHHRAIVSFALLTGLRQANVLKLRWDQIDMESKCVVLDGRGMKNGRDHGIPLSNAAIKVLHSKMGQHHERVFTFNGRPINHINHKTWKLALAKAGIDNFRWHDLRHTWASHMAQQGVPEGVLMELGAWSSSAMVKRYAHLSAGSMRPYAEQMGGILDGVVTQITSQEPMPARPAMKLVASN